MWMMQRYPYYYHVGPQVNFFGIIAFVFFVLFIIWLLSFVFHKDTSKESEQEEGWMEDDTAIQILRERYAKGEITKRQFIDMKKDLEE